MIIKDKTEKFKNFSEDELHIIYQALILTNYDSDFNKKREIVEIMKNEILLAVKIKRENPEKSLEDY